MVIEVGEVGAEAEAEVLAAEIEVVEEAVEVERRVAVVGEEEEAEEVQEKIRVRLNRIDAIDIFPCIALSL